MNILTFVFSRSIYLLSSAVLISGSFASSMTMQSGLQQQFYNAEELINRQAAERSRTRTHLIEFGIEHDACGFHILEPPLSPAYSSSVTFGAVSSEWNWFGVELAYPAPGQEAWGAIPFHVLTSIERVFPNQTASLAKVSTTNGWGIDATFDSSGLISMQSVHGPTNSSTDYKDWYGINHIGGGPSSRMYVALVSEGRAYLKISVTDLVALTAPQTIRVAEDLPVQEIDEVLRKFNRVVSSTFCDPADINQTGLPAILTGEMGSGEGSGLHLEVTQGVPDQIGYALIGTGVADPGMPISNGHLCLAVGTDLFGRYNVVGGAFNSVGVFDSAGVLINSSGTSNVLTGYDVPTPIPVPIGGVIMYGSQWNFQFWYRDGVTGESNFSNGITVEF